MVINETALDKLILELLADCGEVDPPFTRNEITRIVEDHLHLNIQKYVHPSLNRLAGAGALNCDSLANQRGSNHYWLSHADTAPEAAVG